MCDEVGSDVLLDHIQGRLSPEVSRMVQAHLAQCARCRRESQSIQGLASLMSPPALEPSAEADRNVREAIDRAASANFARSVLPEPERRGRPGTRRIRVRRDLLRRSGAPSNAAFWISAAAAAVVFIVLFASVGSVPRPVRDRSARRVSPPPPPTRVETPVRETPKPRVEKPADVAPRPAPEPQPPAKPERELKTPEPFRVPPSAPAPEPRREVARPDTAEPAPPAPAPERPPTVTEKRRLFARAVRVTGKAVLGENPLQAGSDIREGDAVTCRTGSVLIELSDGSLACLRPRTTVTPAAGDGDVRLVLNEGEVACSVAKDPSRRFVVETERGTATVKGTVFAVRFSGVVMSVTVARGRVEAANAAGARDVVADERCFIRGDAAPTKPERVKAAGSLAWAYDGGLVALDTLWIEASNPLAVFEPPMIRGRLFAEGSLSGTPVFSRSDARTMGSWNGRTLTPGRQEGGWVTYTVDLPQTGEWRLWGRLFYPGTGTQLFRQSGPVTENDPNSFFVSVDGGPEQVLGNLKRESKDGPSWYRRWHWGGDGRTEVGRPEPLLLGTLQKGRHTIRIRPRDAVETPVLHLAPRLDVLCLTTDPQYLPQDADYRR